MQREGAAAPSLCGEQSEQRTLKIHGFSRGGTICAEPVVYTLYGLVGDNWNFNASNPVVYVGGNYNQNGNHGMFYVNYTSLTNTSDNHGSRFLLDRFCEHYFLASRRRKRRFAYIAQIAALPIGEDQLLGSG